jgi:uncharacterized protein
MHNLYVKVHDELPVYKISCGHQMVLYVPGHSILTEEIPTNDLRYLLKNPSVSRNDADRDLILKVLTNAQEAKDKWELKKWLPFSTECLTIHTGSDCNLSCSYCYSKQEKTGNMNIKGFPTDQAIESVAAFIAGVMPLNQHHLTVVYHGSGEPSYHWGRLVNSHRRITDFFASKEKELFSYIATNGCLDENQIDWLIENMNLIGLSCDGMPDIQKAQRTIGTTKDAQIERVCKKIIDKGGKFDIRVTVTPNTVKRLPEIVRYLIFVCKAIKIRIEPVYLALGNEFKENDADLFFAMFSEASAIANEHDAELTYSGIRMSELHGTYCDVLRNTIRLIPDDMSRNCFCYMNDKEHFYTGRYDRVKNNYELRIDINQLKQRALNIPEACRGCINEYHCSRGCPDFCIYGNGEYEDMKLNPFRCRLHRLLAVDFAIKSSKCPGIN